MHSDDRVLSVPDFRDAILDLLTERGIDAPDILECAHDGGYTVEVVIQAMDGSYTEIFGSGTKGRTQIEALWNLMAETSTASFMFVPIASDRLLPSTFNACSVLGMGEC